LERDKEFRCFNGKDCLTSAASVCNSTMAPRCPDKSDQDSLLCSRKATFCSRDGSHGEECFEAFACCKSGDFCGWSQICDGITHCGGLDEEVCKGELPACALSVPAVVGIVIGILVLLAIVIGVIVFVVKRRRNRQP